ncbi:MAG: hypothetical protein QOH39_3370 [Verrucomicrobiota bacterium]|jgi:hypothetical protein
MKRVRLVIIGVSLLALSIPAPASIFSGWKPFKKPLEPANKAGEEVTKLISGSKPNNLPPAAQKQVDHITDKAAQADKEYRNAEEALSVQRDNFVLAAVGLALTNTATLAGWWSGRKDRALGLALRQIELVEKQREAIEERLQQINDLYSKKLISDVEYNERRKSIVASL